MILSVFMRFRVCFCDFEGTLCDFEYDYVILSVTCFCDFLRVLK